MAKYSELCQGNCVHFKVVELLYRYLEISDEFLPEFGFPTVVCSNKQFTLYRPCSVKILIITIIILCSLFQTLRNKMNHNSMNAT